MTQTTFADVIPAAPPAAPGMVYVTPAAHRVQKRIALAVMIVPALGTIEAARLWLHHRLGLGDLGLFVLMYGVHMGGVTIGLHRLLAHRAFSTGKVMQMLLVAMGSMAGQGPVLYWVATHRAHHAYSDTDADPHSPHHFGEDPWSKLKGLWHSHMPWMLAPRIASASHFARDLLRDRTLMMLHQMYFLWLALGLVLPAAIGAMIHHSWMGLWYGFVVGGLARMFFANQAAWCVGSVCHMFGSRPFETHDSSGNNWWVAILTFGEGLQNNHHAFPSYYRHAVRWWEPDLSGWSIALFSKLRLASNLRPPSRAAIERAAMKRRQLDSLNQAKDGGVS
jgi:stearoyl-CoA desaturase (delta-9 desaturase)